MNYSKNYLEEQRRRIPVAGGLANLLLTIGGGAGDIVSTVVKPPLDLAKNLGNIERRNIFHRIQKARFGGSESPSDEAIKMVLAREFPSLGSKLTGRVGDLTRLGLFRNIFGK